MKNSSKTDNNYSENDRYITVREYNDRNKIAARYLENQFSDIKAMLVRQDQKIDEIRTKIIPETNLKIAKLNWKQRLQLGGTATVGGAAGGFSLYTLLSYLSNFF